MHFGLSDLEDSGIDWQAFATTQTVKLLDKKKPRQHQIEALAAVKEGLATADRGKLIMACGTGKTYTALHIAEQMVGKGGRVLFLVPSLSLMSQSIREWSIDANIPRGKQASRVYKQGGIWYQTVSGAVRSTSRR